MAIPILTKNVDELVPVVLARAACEKRTAEATADEGQDFTPVATILLEGIGKVREGLISRPDAGICTLTRHS